MDNIRIGIIGFDANTIRRANALAKIGGAEIVAVAAGDSQPADHLAQATGARRLGPDEFPGATQAVLVGASPDSAKHIAAACEAGVHVFASMPFAGDTAAAGRLAKEFSGHPRAFAAGLPARFVSYYEQLRAAVQTGAPGTIGTIRMGRLKPVGEAGGDGALNLMLLGQLSLLEWIFGPVNHLYALAAPATHAGHEYALIAARMRSGAIAHIEAGRTEAAACGYFYYEIAGSEGLIEFDSRIEPEFAYQERKTGPGSAAGPAVALFPEMIPPDAWEREMADFLGSIREGRPARSGWTDALRAMALGEAAAVSARDNKVVELPPV